MALCDQLEPPPPRALLKRDITRVLTPGTVLEEGMLNARRNNWLAAVVVEPAGKQPLRWGLASADVSTGEVHVMQREESSACTSNWPNRGLRTALGLYQPCRTASLVPRTAAVTPIASTPFSPAEAERTLQHHRGSAASMA